MGSINGSQFGPLNMRDMLAGMIALVLVISVGILVVIGRDIPQALTSALGTILGFYFGVAAAYDRRAAPTVIVQPAPKSEETDASKTATDDFRP